MIQEAYVSLEIAKLLKEKGFDEKTDTIYWDSPILKELNISPRVESRVDSFDGMAGSWINHDDEYPRSTHQMVLAWLREKGMYIDIITSFDLNGKDHYSYTIYKNSKLIRKGYTYFDWCHEEATDAAIKYSLENLI